MGRITTVDRTESVCRQCRDARTRGREPVTEERSAETARVESRGVPRPPKWRTRGRLSYGMVAAIVLVYPFASLMFRLRYRHAERLPARGPVLLVANHVSILDPIACARLVFDNGRLPHFLAKQSVFKGFMGTLLRSAGQIPVARFSADAHTALDAAKADLDAGNVIVIYPEGSVTRDPDWWPMQARTGVARLALTSDAVVLPVAQWGPQRVHDYHRKKLHLRFRAPAEYLVGEPIDLTAARAMIRDGGPLSVELLRETTDLIMSRVRDQLAELRQEPAPPTFHPRPRRELPGDLSGSAA
jgi:1-acyl-sn-glycerol-3-phosphate acyltransferase